MNLPNATTEEAGEHEVRPCERIFGHFELSNIRKGCDLSWKIDKRYALCF